MIKIRIAETKNYKNLPLIEQSASQLFLQYGLHNIASMEPCSEQYYLNLPTEESIVYIAIKYNEIIGFCIIETVDNNAYLKEVSVLPDFGGRGIGKELINSGVNWAKNKKFKYILLTTFLDIPFNAPFYKKLGFKEFEINNNYPELLAIKKKENKLGLNIKPRIIMRKALNNHCNARVFFF